MRMAGGIIGLIAGVLGLGAAIVTLMIGGIGSAAEASNADMVVGLGFGGLGFSALAIVFSAIALGVERRWPGVLLMLSAAAGAVLGGTLVAFCMVLALVGGLLATIGGGRRRVPA